MTETLLNRISKHPNDTIVSDAWLTGQTSEIVDLLGNNEFRFIWMTYEFFVKCLSAYKVTHALYLDMGRGWNYAWYQDEEGKVKEIFPESKLAPSYKYRTNWITFYK